MMILNVLSIRKASASEPVLAFARAADKRLHKNASDGTVTPDGILPTSPLLGV